MPTPFREPALGKYQALSEQEQDSEDLRDSTVVSENKRAAAQRSARVWIVFLYYFLSAFGGFILAIALVNFYPGAVSDGEYGNAKLQELLRSMLNLFKFCRCLSGICEMFENERGRKKADRLMEL